MPGQAPLIDPDPDPDPAPAAAAPGARAAVPPVATNAASAWRIIESEETGAGPPRAVPVVGARSGMAGAETG